MNEVCKIAENTFDGLCILIWSTAFCSCSNKIFKKVSWNQQWNQMVANQKNSIFWI